MSTVDQPETCGCCTGLSVRTPAAIANRPGLPELRYRSGTHGDFLASMLARLSDTGHPVLSGLRTRDSDDLTIALLDAWAVACDVLTFYTERLANEAYLGTAVERTSLQELGKLVAYRLAPGVAAETWLAFALERPPKLPVLDPPDPGQSPPDVPDEVVLPAGLRVQSVPGPGEQAQTFETVQDIVARPEWNALPVTRTRPQPPKFGSVDAWLAGVGLNLSAGEAILFAGSDLIHDHWDVRLVTAVDVDTAGNRTHVHWEYGLGSYSPPNDPAVTPEIFVLRKRLAVFGHNAPTWRSMHSSFRAGYEKVHPFPDGTADDDKLEWPGFVSVRTVNGKTIVDLDGAHPDIVRGSWVVISQDGDNFYRELYRVERRAELSRSEFGLSGKITRLQLAGEAHAFGTPREVTVLAVAEPLTLVEAPDEDPVTGNTVLVDGAAGAMQADRALVLAGLRSADHVADSELVWLTACTAAPGGRTTLILRESLKGKYIRSSTTVFGNVAHATHGQSVTQILGSGDARRPFQSYPLQQGPLTYVPADDNPAGAESTLRVEVDGVRWSELASTFGAGPRDRVLVTRDEPDGSRSVVFGDGHRGVRPSTGSNNVRASYRVGLGAAGNLRVGQLSQPLDRPLGLKGVSNPVPATGGVDPQRESDARTAIPIGVRTLGRAVSLQDFADFALAFTGIGKAAAAVLRPRGVSTVVVSVADRDGRIPPASTLTRLATALRGQSDPNQHIAVLPVRDAGFRLAVKVRTDPDRQAVDVLAAIEQALRSRYGRPAPSIGEPVFGSAVIACAAAVPGVLGVDLDRLYRTGATPQLADRLVADPAHAGSGDPVAAELLGLADDGFDWLEELT